MSDEGVTDSVAKTVSRVRRVRALQMVLLSGLLFTSGGIAGWSVYRFAPPPPPPSGDGAGQNGGRPEPPIDMMVQHYQRDLGLSNDQMVKMLDVYKKRFDALKAIRDTIKPKLDEQYSGLKTDMQGILSKDQFAKWDQQYEAVRNRMLPPPPPPRDRPGGMGPPGMDGRGGPPGGRGPDGGPGMNGRDGPPLDGPGGGDGPPPREGPRDNPPPMGGNGP